MSKLLKIKESKHGYQKMISEIGGIIVSARAKVKRDIDTAQANAYWHIGRVIVEFEQKGRVRAEYGQQTLILLSRDLMDLFGNGFSVDNLQNMRRFYGAFPRLLPKYETLSRILSWSLYSELLKEDNLDARSLLGSDFKSPDCHSGESGNLGFKGFWIPVFTGITEGAGMPVLSSVEGTTRGMIPPILSAKLLFITSLFIFLSMFQVHCFSANIKESPPRSFLLTVSGRVEWREFGNLEVYADEHGNYEDQLHCWVLYPLEPLFWRKPLCRKMGIKMEEEGFLKLKVTPRQVAFLRSVPPNQPLRVRGVCEPLKYHGDFLIRVKNIDEAFLGKQLDSVEQEKWFDGDAPIEASGTVERRVFAGRPNYEDVNQGDEPEPYWLLLPGKRLPWREKVDWYLAGSPPADGAIQLVLNKKQCDYLRSLKKGQKVLVKGRGMTRISGHHHTDVLIFADESGSVSIVKQNK